MNTLLNTLEYTLNTVCPVGRSAAKSNLHFPDLFFITTAVIIVVVERGMLVSVPGLTSHCIEVQPCIECGRDESFSRLVRALVYNAKLIAVFGEDLPDSGVSERSIVHGKDIAFI